MIVPSKCLSGNVIPTVVVRSVAGNTCDSQVLLTSTSNVSFEVTAVVDGIVRVDRKVTVKVYQVETPGSTSDRTIDSFNVSISTNF